MRIILTVVAACMCIFSQGVGACLAQGRSELNALIQETQKKSDRPGEMTFVWWIPLEYWQMSFAQNPSTTPEQTEKVLSVFRPYTVVAVVDGKIGAYSTVAYRPEEEVSKAIKVKDRLGNVYAPLQEEEISTETRSFLAAMKPVLSSVLGPMGKNMYFFIFPAQDKSGSMIADAKNAGTFSVLLDDREFKWKLPLASLLSQKTCPICKEKLPGTYKFCPYDGTKLD